MVRNILSWPVLERSQVGLRKGKEFDIDYMGSS